VGEETGIGTMRVIKSSRVRRLLKAVDPIFCLVAVVAVVVVEEVVAAHAHFARDVLTARDVLLCSFRKFSLTLSLISLETFSLLETFSFAHFARNALTARGVPISS
jgi:hypothetical protein